MQVNWGWKSMNIMFKFETNNQFKWLWELRPWGLNTWQRSCLGCKGLHGRGCQILALLLLSSYQVLKNARIWKCSSYLFPLQHITPSCWPYYGPSNWLVGFSKSLFQPQMFGHFGAVTHIYTRIYIYPLYPPYIPIYRPYLSIMSTYVYPTDHH